MGMQVYQAGNDQLSGTVDDLHPDILVRDGVKDSPAKAVLADDIRVLTDLKAVLFRCMADCPFQDQIPVQVFFPFRRPGTTCCSGSCPGSSFYTVSDLSDLAVYLI